MQQFLRDSYDRVIGEIVFSGSTIVLRDSNHRKIGEYRSDDDTTRDAQNRIVGYGNLLTTLL